MRTTRSSNINRTFAYKYICRFWFYWPCRGATKFLMINRLNQFVFMFWLVAMQVCVLW